MDFDKIIHEAVKNTNPIPPCVVTEDARKATEDKLYNLPGLCEKLEDAEGLEALLLSMEIRRIKKHLRLFSEIPTIRLSRQNTSREPKNVHLPPSVPATRPPSGAIERGFSIIWPSGCLE